MSDACQATDEFAVGVRKQGKTKIAAYLLAMIHENKNRKSLWVSVSPQLLENAIEEIRNFSPSLNVQKLEKTTTMSTPC